MVRIVRAGEGGFLDVKRGHCVQQCDRSRDLARNREQATTEGGVTMRTTVLRIGSTLLCIASMILGCSCERQEGGAAAGLSRAPTRSRVAANQGLPQHVSFDPSVNRLIVVWSPAETGDGSGSPYEVMVFPFSVAEGQPRIIGRCSSASAAWNASADGVYVTQGDAENAGIVELGLNGNIFGQSPVFPSQPGGRLSYNRQLDLVVLLLESGEGQTLKLWWPETDRLLSVGLPAGFVADVASQPHICGADPRVVLVSSDHGSFAAYDVDRECWQYASVTPGQQEWKWHDWPADGVRRAGWQLETDAGGLFQGDFFFVDATGSTLWCAADTGYRHAMPPGPDGSSFHVVSPAHRLVPLDVGLRQPDASHGGPSARLMVYGWNMRAVASSDDRNTVAVLYGGPEPGESARVDCVAYRLPPPGGAFLDYRAEHVLYQDGEPLASGGIAMSSERREVAVFIADDVVGQPKLVVKWLLWALDDNDMREWTVPARAP